MIRKSNGHFSVPQPRVKALLFKQIFTTKMIRIEFRSVFQERELDSSALLISIYGEKYISRDLLFELYIYIVSTPFDRCDVYYKRGGVSQV